MNSKRVGREPLRSVTKITRFLDGLNEPWWGKKKDPWEEILGLFRYILKEKDTPTLLYTGGRVPP